MKKWIALLLLVAMLLPSISLVACNTPAPDTENNGSQGNEDDNNENNNGNGETIQNPDKYAPFDLPREKIQGALDEALDRINKKMIPSFTTTFPAHNSTNNVYAPTENTSGWNQGFWTGILWHAYELTGTAGYRDIAMGQIPSYTKRIDEKLGTSTHDMGFLYSLSCVAAFKLTGDFESRTTALKAADNLLSRFHEKGEFIQAWGNIGSTSNYRLIVDCLMNIPLLYWASNTTKDEKYADVAKRHFETTITNCLREDGGTYHTYFFDPVTGAPVRGATHQGVNDESTWARGQAWAIYGTMLTYSYLKNDMAYDAFRAATNYFLDHLPSDYVPYWDFTYGDGAYQPRDSSAAAIAICGILEGLKHLDEDDPLREKFMSGAKRMLNSLIDNYTTKDLPDANGLLIHATYNRNSNTGVDEMNIWGDYFYMEALHRMLDADWVMYW